MPHHPAHASYERLTRSDEREQTMRTNYVLIDFENVHVKSLDLLQGEHFRVVVILGPKNAPQ